MEIRSKFQVKLTDIDVLGQPILFQFERVKNAIKKVKKLKNKLVEYQQSLTKIQQIITQLLEKYLNEKKTPEEWWNEYLTSIYKKKTDKKWENYGWISVTAMFSRLFGQILKDFIEEEMRLKESEKKNKVNYK